MSKADTILTSINEPIHNDIIESSFSYEPWFLSVATLSLLGAVFIPIYQRRREEKRTKYGFHIYIKKKFGIAWNILTYDEYDYKKITDQQEMKISKVIFKKYINKFVKDYEKHRDTIHPLMAFGVLFNLQSLMHISHRLTDELAHIDVSELDEKTLEYGDKLSKKEHDKLNALYLLAEHHISILKYHDTFANLLTIKRQVDHTGRWMALKVDENVLKNQDMILNDLNYLRQHESSIQEIININKLMIQELDSYFEMTKK